MTEPDPTTDPDGWLAEQSTEPPTRRADQILRDMYPHGRRPDVPPAPDWQTSHPHGALSFADRMDPLLDQINPDWAEQFKVSHHASPPPGAVDLIVKTTSPNYLHETLQQLPMVKAVVLSADWNETTQEALIRCYDGCEGFVQYACKNQGYAEVIGILR